MQASYRRHLLLRVLDLRGIDSLLRFEGGVNALRWHDGLPLKLKDKRRVLPVKDDDVDLVAEISVAVDDVCRGRLVALWQVGLQHIEPDLLAGIALCPGMCERLPRDGELLLNFVVKPREQLRKRPIIHADFS